MNDFKKKHPKLQDRRNIYDKLIKDHPDRLPIVVFNHINNNTDIMKLLVKNNCNVYNLHRIVSTKLELEDMNTIVFNIGNTIPKGTDNINDLEKDEDGFIYINVRKENVFG